MRINHFFGPLPHASSQLRYQARLGVEGMKGGGVFRIEERTRLPSAFALHAQDAVKLVRAGELEPCAKNQPFNASHEKSWPRRRRGVRKHWVV